MLDLFLARDPARLVTIESPSGSGKSTLLRQLQAELFSRKRAAVLLQPNADTDALALAAQMLDNLGLAALPPDTPTPGEPLEEMMNRLTQALRARTTPVTILIDDFQRVKSPQTIRLLSRLVYHTPVLPLRLIIASRVPTDIPVATLRLTEDLVELGLDSLRFSGTEAEALRALEAQDLDPAIWQAFNTKVNGWAVALRLALVLLRDQRLDMAGLMAFSGHQRDMAAYLSQLIIEGADDADRPLLLAAAAFETLRPDMLAAVLGPGQAQRLQALITTLALPLEGTRGNEGGRRLHSVVADYLVSQAANSGVDLAELRRQAALYYQGRKQWRRAIRYALKSGDLCFTAGVVEAGGGWRLIYRGEDGTARQFAALMQLSPQHYRAYPRTVLGLAVSAAKRGEIDLALHLLAQTAPVIAEGDPALQAECRLVAALMDLYSDHRIPATVIARLEDDIADIAQVDPVRLALTQNILCFSALQDARFDSAIRFGRLSITSFRTAMSDFGAAHLPLHIGQAEFLSGRSDNARQTLSAHLDECRRDLGARSDLTLMAWALLAEVDLERGENTSDGEQLAAVFEQLGRRDSWFDPLASLVISRMRVALPDGAAAEAVLSAAETVASRRSYHRLARLTGHLRIGMLLRLGQNHEAGRLLDILRSTPWSSAEPDPTNLRGAPLQALEARLLLNRGNPEGALTRLSDLLQNPDITCNSPRMIRLSLLRIRALLAAGKDPEARNALERLALGQHLDRYCLALAEEGPALVDLLTRITAERDQNSIIAQRLAPGMALITNSPHSALGGTQPLPAVVARLTPSEIETLIRLEQGLTNKEIARALQVTDNTVKYHLANIFRKLGVTTRTAAITRARTSGLLATCETISRKRDLTV
ncbi:AAA family ATPase [Xinfangfangia sp. D13-10-4-6]|uniref:LuxR C-terminal-related transcriptional regulator n=1 Tax=Pseudogemmobacter hezensis TaxID=2737662 RepID=UPI001555C582|nr:LuxR C-terminal-related transcriptional regulator [Pseudogemmobacter hezensis]NPD16745.1 AAA family ATPase [Pseudogemmobacter hezensis]